MANSGKYIINVFTTVLAMAIPELGWASQTHEFHELTHEETDDVPSGSHKGNKITVTEGESYKRISLSQPLDVEEWRQRLMACLTYYPTGLSENMIQAMQDLRYALQPEQEPHAIKAPFPIFVMGCPRSGTTVIGNYIGSCMRIYNLVEYTGFYLSLKIAPEHQSRVDAPYKKIYYPSLFEHAKSFCVKQAKAQQCQAYVDSNPFNFLIIKKLQQGINPAIFVIMLRNYRGVISSLERSYKDGRQWAGKDDQERANLYLKFYRCLDDVDPARSVFVNYDELCRQPKQTLKQFKEDFHNKLRHLDVANVHEWTFNQEVFCESHASTTKRKCLGKRDQQGKVKLRSMNSYSPEEWPQEREAAIRPIIEECNQIIKRRRLNLGSPLEAEMPAFPDEAGAGKRKLSEELFRDTDTPAFPEGPNAIKPKKAKFGSD